MKVLVIFWAWNTKRKSLKYTGCCGQQTLGASAINMNSPDQIIDAFRM